MFAAVQAFLLEIRAVENRLRELGAPEDLFLIAATRLRSAFAPAQLPSQWVTHSGPVTGEAVVGGLRWASWVLRHFDENDLDTESLKSLQASVTEQEEILAQSTLPTNLRDLLQRRVSSLRAALHLYKIQGVEPLRQAVHATVGEVVSEDRLNAASMRDASPETKIAVRSGLQMLTKAAEIADKGSKIAKFAQQMYDWGSAGINFAGSMYPMLPNAAPGLTA